MSLIDDLRLDVGDFDTTTMPVVASGVAGALTGVLVTHLRVDVADDDGIVNVVYVAGPSGAAGVDGADGAAGPQGPPGTSVVYSITNVNSTPYTILSTDEIIYVRVNPATVTLPAVPVLGQIFYIKDALGTAGTFNITINPGANTIEGFASYLIAIDRQSLTVSWDGTQWLIL